MADERNLVDEEDTVKENSAQNRREKKKREADSCPDNHFNHCDMDGDYRNSD